MPAHSKRHYNYSLWIFSNFKEKIAWRVLKMKFQLIFWESIPRDLLTGLWLQSQFSACCTKGAGHLVWELSHLLPNFLTTLILVGAAITKGKTLVPCWTGLISGWETTLIKYPVLYSLGSQAGGHQSRLPPLLQFCMWIEFQSIHISTWLQRFSPGTPVSSLRKIDS